MEEFKQSVLQKDALMSEPIQYPAAWECSKCQKDSSFKKIHNDEYPKGWLVQEDKKLICKECQK